LELYCNSALKCLLGEDHPYILSKKADAVQTIGITGALFLSFQFMSYVMQKRCILISAPTLDSHIYISKLSYFEKINTYRYWDIENRCIDFEGMMEDISYTEDNSIILLQACCHNPTGMDLSKEQWISLANLLKAKRIFPIFDISSHGLASGDLDNDAWVVRYFVDQGVELFVCQSFSHTIGIYNETVGNLCIVSNDAAYTNNVKSQLTCLISKLWLNPPFRGSNIVATVLNNRDLVLQWKESIKSMFNRLQTMRKILFQKLQLLATPGSWNHIPGQVGLFSCIGLTKPQIEYLRKILHVYISNDGRINISGLTLSNVEQVARSIDLAVKNC